MARGEESDALRTAASQRAGMYVHAYMYVCVYIDVYLCFNIQASVSSAQCQQWQRVIKGSGNSQYSNISLTVSVCTLCMRIYVRNVHMHLSKMWNCILTTDVMYICMY